MTDRMKLETADGAALNVTKIAEVFPETVVEGKVNFDVLRTLLGDEVFGDEAYEFTWVGKREAIREAGRPIRKTLRPCVEESKNWDTTENLYIEGDNLDVLKLLQESYLGKVKMIYIDPPYNTGNDFVYRDDFAQSREEYEDEMGVYDEDDNRLFRNTESNGRFHSDWCSMMYPRLVLARNMLSDDGVIFISIDDGEVAQLRKMCDEVFGEICFAGDISWQRTYSPRNDAKGVPKEVEHIIVYSKNNGWVPQRLERTAEMDAMYRSPDGDETLWASGDPAAAGGVTHQGMVYAIQHPFTGKIMYPPSGSHWRIGQSELLSIMNEWAPYELRTLSDATKRAQICGISEEEVRQGVKGVVLSVPEDIAKRAAQKRFDDGKWPLLYFTSGGVGGIRRKRYLDESQGRVVTNFWPYSEVGHTDEAKKQLKALFDGVAPFDTPKPVRLISRMLDIATDEQSIILDFFSGSATTAEAVMQQDAQNGGCRKFIMVQLPEEASGQYENLCEIGKERIRRAGDKIAAELAEANQQLQMSADALDPATGAQNDEVGEGGEIPGQARDDEAPLDIGFRVLKLDDTNMKDVYYSAGEYSQDMLEGLESNIKDDRTDLDLLYGSLIDWGLPLSLPHTHEEIDGVMVHTYNGGDLIACFADTVSEAVVRVIASRQPLRAVFRDSSFSSSPEKINVEEIFKLLAPNTTVRVI